MITGASGVGKTSLANLLAKELNLPIIDEVARRLCHQMGYQNPTKIPNQELFRKTVLREQIEEEKKYSSFIADRSTIDCWVLWQRWHMCSAMTFDTESYYDTCRKHASSYTHIIYVTPSFVAPDDDGFRWTEPDYIKQIDRSVRLTLYDWSLLERTFTVHSTVLEERLAAVQSHLLKL